MTKIISFLGFPAKKEMKELFTEPETIENLNTTKKIEERQRNSKVDTLFA